MNPSVAPLKALSKCHGSSPHIARVPATHAICGLENMQYEEYSETSNKVADYDVSIETPGAIS
jgi:hypothetical protein